MTHLAQLQAALIKASLYKEMPVTGTLNTEHKPNSPVPIYGSQPNHLPEVLDKMTDSNDRPKSMTVPQTSGPKETEKPQNYKPPISPKY